MLALWRGCGSGGCRRGRIAGGSLGGMRGGGVALSRWRGERDRGCGFELGVVGGGNGKVGVEAGDAGGFGGSEDGKLARVLWR